MLIRNGILTGGLAGAIDQADQVVGKVWHVKPTGNDASDGQTWQTAKATPQAAVTACQSHDNILVAGGDYGATLTVPRTKSNITIKGIGGPGAVSIAPAGVNVTAITIHGRDVRLENIGGAGTGTGAGIRVTGRRFSCDEDCKFENDDGTGAAAVVGPGRVADIYDADDNPTGTQDKGDFSLWEGAEFAYAAKGVILQGSDYGACGPATFLGCRSKGITGAHFAEAHLAGGANRLHYRDLLIHGHTFDYGSDDDGAAIVPTAFLDLNDNDENLGEVTDCKFPVAQNAAKLLVSAGLLCVGNKHPAGNSTGQPT